MRFKYLGLILFSGCTPAAAQGSSDNGSNILLFLFIGICVAGYIIYKKFKNRCSSCGKWGALKKTDSELIDSQNSTVKKVLKTKNAKGEVIRTKEVLVPAKTHTYRIYYQCKYCSNMESRKKYVTEEN